MSKKAQHIAEFALLAGIVLTMLTAMNLYVKRGLQGRYKQFADTVYRKAFDREGGQYEPTYITQLHNITSSSKGNIRYEESENIFHRTEESRRNRSGEKMELPVGIEGGMPQPPFHLENPSPTIHEVKPPPEDVIKKGEGRR